MAADVARFKARLTSLKALRAPHEATWKDCLDYSLPHLAVGFFNSPTTPSNAAEIQQQKARLLSGVAGESIGTAVDGFVGGMVPSNALWFGLDVPGSESDEERAWLSDAARAVWENLHASNFDAEIYDSMQALLGAGWSVIYIEEGEGGGYHTENWPIQQCCVASSRPGGRVDTIYREFPLTAAEVIETYGKERASESTLRIAATNPDSLVQVAWAIEPRRDYLPGAQLADRLPFASVQWEVASNHVLRESGYHEFPCSVPRWRRIPGTAYGIGPMSDALPDTKTANEVARWELAAAETAIAPPLVAKDDGVLNARTVRLGPRKIIVAASTDNIKPLITGARVDFGQLIVERMEAKIRRALMADLFDSIFRDPSMTATQVHAILQQIRQRMGPRFGRLQSELLQPLIERCYGLAFRAGALGRPPESLVRRGEYVVRYESPLARAQKIDDVAAMDRFEGTLGQQMAVQPDIADLYDWEAGARHRASLLGVPQDLVRGTRAVQRLREQRAQAQAQAQQQQMAAQAQAVEADALATQLAGA